MLTDFIKRELEILDKNFLKRRLKVVESPQEAVIYIEGKKTINLSSNNYLGLANHPKLRAASKKAIDQFGTSSSASRLISGNNVLYKELEDALAKFKKTEKSLVFTSGYTANVGIIQALVGRGDHIFLDKLNHASIVDGAILSRCEINRYPHKNTEALAALLKKSDPQKKKLVITDSLFSMDGDVAPLAELHKLSKKYNAFFMVDEAHAAGVFGKSGSGLLEELGISDPDIIQMGTFSKSLGSLGGYIAGKKDLIEYLLNKSRSFIYTTALPPAVLGASLAGLRLAEDSSLRDKLWDNIKFFNKGLKEIGFTQISTESQIIPLILGDSKLTLKFSGKLFDEGIFALGIRPPTVPEGTSRIRIAITAMHTKNQLEECLSKFKKIGKVLGVI